MYRLANVAPQYRRGEPSPPVDCPPVYLGSAHLPMDGLCIVDEVNAYLPHPTADHGLVAGGQLYRHAAVSAFQGSRSELRSRSRDLSWVEQYRRHNVLFQLAAIP